MGNGNAFLGRPVEPLPTSRRAAEMAGSLGRFKCLAQVLVLDREGIANLRSREHHARGQKAEHLLQEIALLSALELSDDLQVGRLGVGRGQEKPRVVRRGFAEPEKLRGIRAGCRFSRAVGG